MYAMGFQVFTGGMSPKLAIPDKFSNAFLIQPGDYIFLKVSDGEIWQVAFSEDDVGFEEGWDLFKKHCGIRPFYYSSFQPGCCHHIVLVKIYDDDKNEISYEAVNNSGFEERELLHNDLEESKRIYSDLEESERLYNDLEKRVERLEKIAAMKKE